MSKWLKRIANIVIDELQQHIDAKTDHYEKMIHEKIDTVQTRLKDIIEPYLNLVNSKIDLLQERLEKEVRELRQEINHLLKRIGSS